MSPNRPPARAAVMACTAVLTELHEDHKLAKKACLDFQKLDAQEDRDSMQVLLLQALDDLTVHATREEELLAPAARDAIADVSLIDEAAVEHASVRALIEQLRADGDSARRSRT